LKSRALIQARVSTEPQGLVRSPELSLWRALVQAPVLVRARVLTWPQRLVRSRAWLSIMRYSVLGAHAWSGLVPA